MSTGPNASEMLEMPASPIMVLFPNAPLSFAVNKPECTPSTNNSKCFGDLIRSQRTESRFDLFFSQREVGEADNSSSNSFRDNVEEKERKSSVTSMAGTAAPTKKLLRDRAIHSNPTPDEYDAARTSQ